MKKLLIIFLFAAGCLLYAEGSLDFFSLNYSRTTTVNDSAGSSVCISGKLYVQKNPGFVYFETDTPVKDAFVCTQRHCYEEKADGWVLNDSHRKFIIQSAVDLRNWLCKDFNLENSGWRITSRTFATDSINGIYGNYLQQVWTPEENIENPVKKIISFSDKEGRFVKLEIYLAENELMAETFLSEWTVQNNISFPSVIRTVSYAENSVTQSVELKLSDLNLEKYQMLMPEFVKLSEMEIDWDRQETVLKENEKNQGFSLLGLGVDGCYYLYKNFITSQDTTRCRYSPSCSRYMVESVKKHGICGFIEGMDRLRRCTASEKRELFYDKNEKGNYIDSTGQVFADKIKLQDEMYKKLSADMAKPLLKSRSGATALSVILPGAGHIYLGNYTRGVGSMISVGAFTFAAVYTGKEHGIKNWRPWLYGSMALGSWVTDIYGANTAALRMNNAELKKNYGTPQIMDLGKAEENREITFGNQSFYCGLIENLLKNENYSEAEELFCDLIDVEQNLFSAQELKVFEKGFNAVRNFDEKSPVVAGFMSIIPGMGQFYAHQWRDGTNALLLNGGLIALSVWTLMCGDVTDFCLLELSLDLRFYKGNLYNAQKGVYIYNREKKQALLKDVYRILETR